MWVGWYRGASNRQGLRRCLLLLFLLMLGGVGLVPIINEGARLEPRDPYGAYDRDIHKYILTTFIDDGELDVLCRDEKCLYQKSQGYFVGQVGCTRKVTHYSDPGKTAMCHFGTVRHPIGIQLGVLQLFVS